MIESPWRVGYPVLVRTLGTQISHSDSSLWSTHTDLDTALAAGALYHYQARFIWRGTVLATGMRIRFSNKDTLTMTRMAVLGQAFQATSGTSAVTGGNLNALATAFNFANTAVINSDMVATFDGLLFVNAAGTMRVDVGNETTPDVVTLEVGSSVIVTRLA